jgi:hypothetical protein
VAIESPAATWTVEGGDLLSEARGLGRGLRVSRRIGGAWRPGVSVYVHDNRLPGTQPAISYRDSLMLHRNVDVRGELATDGSVFLATRLLAGRGSLETFYRYAAWRAATDRGVSVSYDIWHGISAYGGLRLGETDTRERWQMLGLTVPTFRHSSVSLEQTRTTRGATDDTNRAVGLQLPIGPLRVMQRFQWTDVAFLEGPSLFEAGRRQLQSMASYAPSPRLRFTYQVATQWLAGTEARQWTELESVFRLSSRTSFHAVTGFPQFSSPQRLRIGVQQALPGTFRLSIDYGRLPAFESSARVLPTDPRLLVMVRRATRLPTPAGGADVFGVVRDDSGAPVHGAVVSLGRFLTTTATDGSYRFRHVPPGSHTLSLPADHLPAAYARSGEPSTVVVAPHDPVRADLRVTALRAIHGRVFLGANGNGQREGIAGVVVRLDENGPATMTADNGEFHFYNLQPGPYVVWVDTTRLRLDLGTVGSGRRRVELQPDRASTDVELAVSRREKPVLMKEAP